MKFIVTSLACFIAVFLLCVYSSFCVINVVDDTAEILETAISSESIGQKASTLQIVQQAEEMWKRHEVFFGTVLRHDEIDSIVEEFARLKSYAVTEDQDDFLSNCRALIARLDHVKEMEQLTFSNIM